MILVTGATGLNGGLVVRRLSENGIPVRALVREPDTRNAANADALGMLPGVTVVEGDLAQPESLARALDGVDKAVLISTSDSAMADVQSAFVDAAKKASVGHIVKLSGIMPELDSDFRFARMHGQVEKHIEASGIAFTHLRAGEFMQAYFRQIPSIVARGAIMLPMEDARIASIDATDVAAVTVDILTTPGHEGRTYPLTGPEALTMTEVAERLSDATGIAIRYINVAPEDAKTAQRAAGFPDYLVDGLGELFAERRRGKESTVSTVIPDVFGWQPSSFLEFATRNAAAFRGE
jgi:uncharacterized protein YbjT (DUF2867 family)